MRAWIAASSGRPCATFVNDDFFAFSRPASACCKVGGGPAIALGALKNALSLVIGASAMVASANVMLRTFCGYSFRNCTMMAPPREFATKCASRMPKCTSNAFRSSACAVSE